MDVKNIGQLIASCRKELSYTQEAFGRMLGVSGKAVSKWERGLCLPDVTLFNKIAVTLKISLAQLLSGNRAEPTLSSNLIFGAEPAGRLKIPECKTVPCAGKQELGIVSPYLYGSNLEHSRSSIWQGLSAQLLKNRKFAGKPSAMEGVAADWFAIGKRTFCAFGAAYTHHMKEFYHMKRRFEHNSQDVLCCEEGVPGGIGQHGIPLAEGRQYVFAMVAKCDLPITVTVRLTDRKGACVYADARLSVEAGTEWKRYELFLSSSVTDEDADLRITFDRQTCLSIGCLSLMDADNFHGMRRDVVAAMKELGITVLRWPGGNFAGEYSWFDGLLPVDERSPFESYLHLETQPHTLCYDFHEINTDDFIALCREINAEPYITINTTWNTPEENAAWVEYCNGDETTTYGRLRAERGYKEPYNVLLWTLGNEPGYGHMEGDNTAAGYSRLAKENAVKMLEKCKNLTLCSSGPYPNQEWVSYSAKPLTGVASLVSMHFYAHEPSYTSLKALPEEYEACLAGVLETRANIRQMRAMLGEGPRISFDEWNVWYSWYRPGSVIDGMFAALMMHMFIGEAPRSGVDLVCHFEAVNEGAIRVTPGTARLTAMGQMIARMKLHCNGRLLYADELAVVTRKENVTTVTLINPSHERAICFRGEGAGRCISKTLYAARDLLPVSNFEEQSLPLTQTRDAFAVDLPPISVAVLQFDASER